MIGAARLSAGGRLRNASGAAPFAQERFDDLSAGNTSMADCVSHNSAMLEIRFTQAARRHRIGRASVRHVMATVAPIGTITAQGARHGSIPAVTSGAAS